MKYRDFKDFDTWKKARVLVKEIHLLLKKLPKHEDYALSIQMRRAAISISSNLAEGHDRQSSKEFLHFISIARGSRSELESQLILCLDLDYLTDEETKYAFSLLDEINKMTTAMTNTLLAKLNSKGFTS